MNEAEWLECTDPQKMLEFLRGRASDRKFHLFAVAQCRRLSVWFDAPVNVQDAAQLWWLLNVGERAADGLADQVELRKAEQLAYDFSSGGWGDFVGGAIGWSDAREIGTPFQHPEEWACRTLATAGIPVTWYQVPEQWSHAAKYTVTLMVELASVKAEEAGEPTAPAEQAARADLAVWVRELFGNAFQPVVFDPAWRTPEVARLSQAIYERRAFDLLPEFADVLEVAGCTNQDLLVHCRSRSEHARGCWALDLVLGKE